MASNGGGLSRLQSARLVAAVAELGALGGECTKFSNEGIFMAIQTFKFKEGTVIVSVSQEVEFDMKAKIITDTRRFTACLIVRPAPGIKTTKVIKTTRVKDAKGKSDRIFRSEEAAFKAGYQLATKLGYHATTKTKR